MNHMTEPHDIDAEQAVLGAMLLSAAATETCRQALVPADFYRPAHQVIFAAITAAVREGVTPDAVTIKDRLENAGELGRVGHAEYLHTLLAACPAPASAQHYARIVRGHAVTRRLREAAGRVLQLTQGVDLDDAHGLTERALREFEAVRDAGIGDGITIQTISEFLGDDDQDDTYDWVIPGLLERGDRLMLTGAEGAGKTTLFSQFAVCAAAGIHPLTFEQIKPARIMFIDCENTPRHTRRKLRPLVSQARLQGRPVDDANLWIECRPQGMDLALDKDLSWLLRQAAAVMPDITFVGPLYRLAPRALQTDDEAAPVIAALNMIRARGSAVVLEAHAGHSTGPGGRRDLRPRGSSAFLGWPEFGYGLRWAEDDTARAERTVEMVGWRGDRDEREWPEMLTAGGRWPWRVHVWRRAIPGDDWSAA
jgi:replicative DNA helicase